MHRIRPSYSGTGSLAFKILFGLALFVVALTAADWVASGKLWWRHVQYLASDELAGRDVGTPGYDKAANYVAEEFKQAGLQPGAGSGFFQPVAFTKVSIDRAQSSLVLIRDGQQNSIPVPQTAQLGYSTDSEPVDNAPLIFAGYGLKIPEAHYDDLKGLDIAGAVVVFLTGGPEKIDGSLRSHYSSGEERWKALHAAGAAGMISIANPKTMEIPWERQEQSWGRSRMSLADRTLASAPGMKFSAGWNPAKADELLTASGHTFDEILAAAKAQKPLPHFKLPSSLTAHVTKSEEKIVSKNVVAVRQGTDPALRNEYVVISAHLDHLGTGADGSGDRIYNGAMDDASGVASVIEIAKSLGRIRIAIPRSIVFLAVTGEEKGELGSKYFAENPNVNGKIIADLNMDMFLPLFPLKWLEVQGLNESTLGDDVRKVAEAAGVRVQADKEPNRNRFIRSDQYSFIKKGSPSLAFKFGYVPGGREEKIFKDWYTSRYHGLTDDTSQPVDLAAAAQFNSILRSLAMSVALAQNAPEWKPNSFFRRFAK